MTRRHPFTLLPRLAPLLLGALLIPGTGSASDRPPNIVMFVVDDMNDWIGPLGHKQAITPNIDRLAEIGVNFSNAHTAGIFCAPSRTAFFTGRHAFHTGCYTTQVYTQHQPETVPLQVVLHQAGYSTHGGGKLFHHREGYVDHRGWSEFFVRDPAQKLRGWSLDSWNFEMDFLPQPFPYSPFNQDREVTPGLFLEWGPVKNEHEGRMADTIRTEWACDILRRKHEKPLFVAVGLYAPHFPNYAPQKYFDLYDPEKIELPPYKADDLEDLPEPVKRAKTARSAHHRKLEKLDAIDDAIHGYLACISYADAMLGRVLDAIESGPNADNTIVILWSDHGYHHGQKFDWGKHTLWERTSNVPLIFAGPGVARGHKVDTTVSLIDLFPTLTGIAGARDDRPRDGVSLLPVLKDPASARDREVLLPGMKPEEYAVINRDWRYIRYSHGGEELYDLKKDPHEWHNLASDEKMAGVIAGLRAKAPRRFAPPGPEVNQLKLVTEGEEFRWELKPPRKPKPANKQKPKEPKK